MNRRFLISGISASVFFFLWGFLVHGLLLTQDYMQIQSMFRPEAEAMGNMPYMILAHVIMGFALAWIYSQGISGASWIAQGLRFGLAAALLVTFPWYLIYYSVQPWPAEIVVKQVALDSLGLILAGLLVAFINKDSSTANS
ncbi:MAG TPA: hypothetical protein VFZ23_17955 [Pyrinomonadaceae bacterium]